MTFKAFVLEKEDQKVDAALKDITFDQLPEGDVTVRVAYSSVNYKDGLAVLDKSPIVKNYPFIPGIDLAGVVTESKSDQFKEGDNVIVTSYGLGVTHYGGFSEYARVPADWVVPLPEGLSLKEAMAFGTAGLTAALAVQRLEDNGLTAGQGPVLVTGATGGVGSLAVAMLSDLGYEVYGSTGKETEHGFLKQLGAAEVIDREEVVKKDNRPLNSQKWAAAVDPVGGKTLEYLLTTVKTGGSVALMGLAGGAEFSSTVHPFILRGINLLGIDSVFCPYEKRKAAWERIATDLKVENKLEGIINEISFDQLPETLSGILQGKVRGRTIVKISEE
ncbi:acryloyl-CoA reductase [Pseudalkalibacillus caeni]|uniref:Acryloyl-CoA reductase n=1 Tax=Exobacillus caeni TaxID=2574798 RepID=A0A5R9F154_9BACL|nr:acryloyl-CoA reductase [Pseudalkalibacillus caeni]TLS37297.1 acryloyl-CoA reductase [Pseudalkalibacillus caeni]